MSGVKAAGSVIRNGSSLLDDLCGEIDQLKDCTDILAGVHADKPDAGGCGCLLLSGVLTDKPDAEAPLLSARYMHDQVLPAMAALRTSADRLEQITDRACWPFPTYDELLFSIQ